jgi:hypothetical protein
MIAEDRTWAFPLHEAGELARLGISIRSSLSNLS